MFEEYFAAGKFKTKCNYEWIPELRNSITLLMFKTNIQLINEHEECPLEQFEKKKFKLYSQKVAKKRKLTLADGV